MCLSGPSYNTAAGLFKKEEAEAARPLQALAQKWPNVIFAGQTVTGPVQSQGGGGRPQPLVGAAAKN